MNKSIVLKVCSVTLVLVMCLFTVTGCKDNGGTTAGSSSTISNTDNSSDVTSTDSSSSDITSTDAPTTHTTSSNTNTVDKNASETSSNESFVDVTVTQNVEYDANKNPLKRGVNFSGLEGNIEFGYDSWIFQAKYYDAVREKGFDHIRLPVDFFLHMGEAPQYKIDEEFLRKVDTIINTSLSAGLKIVLDFHHFGELVTNVKGNKQKYYKMWEQLSIHYQSYPSGLIFELINEPGNAESLKAPGPDKFTPNKIIEIQEEAIKIIRKTNPTRLIVHATSWNNGAAQLMNTEPLLPDDKNIILSVHCYEPMSFTHQGADWDGDGVFNPPTDFTDDMKHEIELVFEMVKKYQETYGRPVWIGEFGVFNSKTPEGARAKYAEFLIETMKDAKCGWCWWDFKDGFGLYSVTRDQWIDEPLMDALMK